MRLGVFKLSLFLVLSAYSISGASKTNFNTAKFFELKEADQIQFISEMRKIIESQDDRWRKDKVIYSSTHWLDAILNFAEAAPNCAQSPRNGPPHCMIAGNLVCLTKLQNGFYCRPTLELFRQSELAGCGKQEIKCGFPFFAKAGPTPNSLAPICIKHDGPSTGKCEAAPGGLSPRKISERIGEIARRAERADQEASRHMAEIEESLKSFFSEQEDYCGSSQNKMHSYDRQDCSNVFKRRNEFNLELADLEELEKKKPELKSGEFVCDIQVGSLADHGIFSDVRLKVYRNNDKSYSMQQWGGNFHRDMGKSFGLFSGKRDVSVGEFKNGTFSSEAEGPYQSASAPCINDLAYKVTLRASMPDEYGEIIRLGSSASCDAVRDCSTNLTIYRKVPAENGECTVNLGRYKVKFNKESLLKKEWEFDGRSIENPKVKTVGKKITGTFDSAGTPYKIELEDGQCYAETTFLIRTRKFKEPSREPAPKGAKK